MVSGGRVVVGALLALALGAGPGMAGDGKVKKPRLDLRASPKFGFSPLNVFLTAELMGGDEVEDLYCPELEWEWDDGGKSIHEADCPPYEAGVTKLERRFTAEHGFRRAGTYNIKVTMRRAGRSLAAANVRITVRAGLGDPTMEN